jgi:hypothetical protein
MYRKKERPGPDSFAPGAGVSGAGFATPVEPEKLSRLGVAALCVAAYCVYVLCCFAIEHARRERFPVAPRAAGAAAQHLSQRERLHQELGRIQAQREQESWPPYVWFETVAVSLSCLGFLAGASLVLRTLLRRRGGAFSASIHFGVMGVILGATAGGLLFLWPLFAAGPILDLFSR